MKNFTAYGTSPCSLLSERKEMKKAIVILAICLSAFIASGQDPQTNSAVSGMSIVPTPIHVKVLYQNRTNNAQHIRTKDDAIVSALRFFKRTQNPDGSWGGQNEQTLATPLILMSFLGRGEKATSREFSNTVINARTWVLNSAPTGTATRVATAVSLLGYCDISYSDLQSEGATEVAKIMPLLNQISPTNNNIWVDFASFYTMSTSLLKPLWLHHTKETDERYLNVATNLAPLTVEEYLKMHMTSLAAFRRGGKPWYEFNRTSTIALMNRQQSDGCFPVSDGQSRFVATALATLRLEIYYQYEPQLQAKPESKRPD